MQRGALFGSVSLFIYSLGFWLESNPYTVFFNHYYQTYCFGYPLAFGVDNLSLFLILLTTFIFPFCFLTTWSSVPHSLQNYILVFVSLETLILLVFLSLDFFFFYLMFEFSLIPMFLLIGWWGARERKMKAAYYLFLYTLCGSLFMLLAIVYLLLQYGTTHYFVLLSADIPTQVEYVLWPAIFVALAIKVPMFPFHIWLPEAHVEAPTAGSVLLAGLVLKLGGYGMLRFLLPILPSASVYYAPAAAVLALMGGIYGSLTALRQIDMKRIIAYSSIAHMNFGLLGLFSLTLEGASGFYYIMIGHGLVSSALFFLVGVVYDRYHSRLYSYYQGLALRMPLYCLFFFFFTVANIAFPGTINFPGEFLVFCGLAKSSWLLILAGGVVLFFSTIYSFWLFNRVAFGTVRVMSAALYYDLSRLEMVLFGLLSLGVLLGGLFPNSILLGVTTSLLLFF